MVKKEVGRIVNNDYTLSIFNKVYSILIGIVSTFFYVRYLGIEYKGIYSYINEIALIISLIANLGIYQSYIYYYRRKENDLYPEYCKIFLWQHIIYWIAFLIVSLIFTGEEYLILAILQVPPLVLKNQMDNVILIENIKLYMVVDIVYKSFLFILYLFLWLFFPTKLMYIVVGVVILNLCVCIYYFIITKNRIFFSTLFPDGMFVAKTIIFGSFPMLSALLLTLNYSLDIIFLKFFGTSVELSVYSISANIINYVWIVPNAFKEVLISRIARGDDEKIFFSTKISIYFTLVCFIIFIFIGKPLVIMFFGIAFSDCYIVVIILFLGALSMILFKMLGTVFVAEGKRISYFVILLISVIANVIANILFIPKWGMYGAAWASVISYNVCGLAFLLMYCRFKNANVVDVVLFSKNELKVFVNGLLGGMKHDGE